jgi:hypothetical protein
VTPASTVTSDTGEAARPLLVGADILGKGSLFVGDDFALANDSGATPPDDPSKADPPEAGVLKVNNDLFLNGEFYVRVAGEWLTMKDYLQSFIPDVQVGRQDVIVVGAPDANGVVEDTVEIVLTTRLKDPQKQAMSLALTSISWLTTDDFATWEPLAPGDQKINVSLTTSAPQKVTPSKFKFTVGWSVEPVTNGGGTPISPIAGFTFSYTAVFDP